MVVMGLLATALMGVTHERMASPSICTVHAPQTEMPQLYLVPVKPMISRITHNKGMSASTSRLYCLPLTVMEYILQILIREWIGILACKFQRPIMSHSVMGGAQCFQV